MLLVPLAATVVATFPPMLTGAVAVQIDDDLGTGVSGVGLAVAFYYAGGALASTPLGHASDRLGAAASIRIGMACIAGALLLILVVQSPVQLAVAMFAAGLASAIVHPAVNVFLVHSVDPGRLGFAIGIKQSAAPLATLLAGLAVPAIALTIGWRWAFGGAALTAVGVALVPCQTTTSPHASRAAASGDGMPRSLVVLLAAAYGLGVAGSSAIATFLVASMTDAGIANGTAGLLMAGGSLVGLATRFGTGVRADRRGRGHLRRVILMLVAGAVTFGVLAIGTPLVYVLMGPLAFASAWGWSGLFQLALVQRNPSSPGAATGVVLTGGFIGGVAGPLVLGAIAETRSFSTMWIGAGLCSLCAALLIAHARRSLTAHRS